MSNGFSVNRESFAAKCEQRIQEIGGSAPHVFPDMEGNREMIPCAFAIGSIKHWGRFHARNELHRQEARVDGRL